MCNWNSGRKALGIGLLGQGLKAQYQNKALIPETFKKFEPTTINGYPALHFEGGKESQNGVYNLDLGLSDNQMALIQANDTSSLENAKKIAETVAKAVVQQAKSGGR